MTEVFDAWALERAQKQPRPYAQPNLYAQQYPYAQPPQYQGQPWRQQQQQSHPQIQAAYNYSSPATAHAHLAGHPTGSAMSSPAPAYTSPVSYNAVPNGQYGYAPPQGGAVEMPAELPAETWMAPVQGRSISTDVSFSSVANLARDLWGADSRLEEEEKVVV